MGALVSTSALASSSILGMYNYQARCYADFSIKRVFMRRILLLWTIFTSVWLTGCMTVPNEVVQLSALTTSDTRTLHDGYRKLVRQHFAALRKVREQEFADKTLAPYIQAAVTEGRLIDVVKGDVVWDNDKSEFVKPNPNKATVQKLDSINTWTREVSATIEVLREDAYKDLVKLENDVLDEVDRAFGNLTRGGSTIHAFLLSLQKIEASQNEFLKAIGLEDLPKKLNNVLDKASTDAAKWSAKVDEVPGKVEMLKETTKKLKGK
jgi:hypothetical protein